MSENERKKNPIFSKFSQSTFLNLIPNWVHENKRRTDCCPTCVILSKAVNKIDDDELEKIEKMKNDTTKCFGYCSGLF